MKYWHTSGLFILFPMAVILTLLTGCDKQLTEDVNSQITDDVGPDSTGGYQLYAGYEGNLNHGILIIDIEEYTIIDSILLDDVPLDMSVSSDSSLLFVATNNNIVVIELDGYSIIDVYNTPAIWMATSEDGRYIFVGNRNNFSVIDRQVNAVIFAEDSLRVLEVKADNLGTGAYVAYVDSNMPFNWGGIFHYSTSSNQIDQYYPLISRYQNESWPPNGLVVQNDGGRIFFTNGFALYSIDRATGEQIEREVFTHNAQMAVTSDDHYIYITSPGDFPVSTDDRVPNPIMYRYDITSGTLEEYIDFRPYYENDENLTGSPGANKITLLPGDQTGFISWGDITVWDLPDKRLLGIIIVGKNRHTQIVRAIAIAPKY